MDTSGQIQQKKTNSIFKEEMKDSRMVYRERTAVLWKKFPPEEIVDNYVNRITFLKNPYPHIRVTLYQANNPKLLM